MEWKVKEARNPGGRGLNRDGGRDVADKGALAGI